MQPPQPSRPALWAGLWPGRIGLSRPVPFPVLALAVCALFALAGVAVLDDYGVEHDEVEQRRITIANIQYMQGEAGAFDELRYYSERFYGMAFEVPLLLIERGLGLQQFREIYLLRHLLSHLLFIAGGFFCGLLVYRAFGSRWLALLAMLMFLLHPRLYAHSFFNSKDGPFLATFMIALHLAHRAFRKETAGAFLLCGLGVGLATNLRIFGLLLLLAILAMRRIDLSHASCPRRRKRIAASGLSFLAAALATIYALEPYYWQNPFRFLEALWVLSHVPAVVYSLFQGEIVRSDALPPQYLPTWFAITTPPPLLLLGGLGAALVCAQGLARPGRILRNGRLRLRLLWLGCLVLPVGAGVALQANIHGGWRNLYFLWGPFCLLAAAGLHWLAGEGQAGGARGRNAIWHLHGHGLAGKGRARCAHGQLRRVAAYGLTAAGLAAAAASIVSLHPHSQVYFNLLVDRETPGQLGRQYSFTHFSQPQRQALEYLLERYPDRRLNVLDHRFTKLNLMMLPEEERKRIALSDAWQADFYIDLKRPTRSLWNPADPRVHSLQAYGSGFLDIVAPQLIWGAELRPSADTYRAAYQSVVAADRRVAQAVFDIHVGNIQVGGIQAGGNQVGGKALYYIKENCAPADASARFFLHVFPAKAEDLPLHRRESGFENLDFAFARHGGFFDGKCITQEPLPGYPIARIRTGQFIPGEEELWEAELAPLGRAFSS